MTFVRGDTVRVAARPHEGHHRTPGYLKGQIGTVERVHGRFPNPETRAYAGDGLPELPLPGRALLNGGSEIEFFRYARHGEGVIQRSTYADIYERQSKNGPMLFVVTETEYLTQSGELLMRARKTAIRR